MKLIRGKLIAGKILKKLKKDITTKKVKPHLAVVLVGENRASKLYVELKAQVAKKIGMALALYKFKSGAKERDIIKLIKALNKDKKISGIIVQLPLPKKYRVQRIISAISPRKDADGFHPKNIKKYLAGRKVLSPVFPGAVMSLLKSAGVDLKNKKGIVISNSDIFGKIMTKAMEQRGTKTIYLLSKDLEKNIDKLKSSDILVTAVGKPKIIKGEMIKKGAIVIDGGIKKIGKKVLGDVDFNSVVKIAGYLSPVPRGVGPATVACLLENVYRLALKNKR